MQLDLNKIKPIIRHRSFFPTAIIVLIDCVLLASLVFAGYLTFNKYSALETAQMELAPQKETATLIQNNKALLSRSIESHNALLNSLIPNEETYFIVIAALEKLAAETGVTIESYNINLSETTEEKLSLELAVYGNTQAIDSLIRTYRFASGRLMTNEGISLNFDEQGEIGFSINLYHRAFSNSNAEGGGDVTVTKGDVELLESIQAQMR